MPNIKFTPPFCVDREAADECKAPTPTLDTTELERELESLCMSVTSKVMDKDT